MLKLGTLFKKSKPRPSAERQGFEPDPRFGIGTIELLANALVDHGTFSKAFEAIGGWNTMDRPGGGVIALNGAQKTGGVLLDTSCDLTFGQASMAHMEFMVIDMWMGMRKFSYSGFRTLEGANNQSLATLAIGGDQQLEFRLTGLESAEPLPGLKMPGTRMDLRLVKTPSVH